MVLNTRNVLRTGNVHLWWLSHNGKTGQCRPMMALTVVLITGNAESCGVPHIVVLTTGKPAILWCSPHSGTNQRQRKPMAAHIVVLITGAGNTEEQ